MSGSPVDFRESEIEVAQGAADSDVGEGEGGTHAPVAVAQLGIHHGQGGGDHLMFAFDPGVAALSNGPLRLHADADGSIHQAVGQGFPTLDFDALAIGLRIELVVRRQVVEVFDDHRRIEDGRLVVEYQHGYPGQWVVAWHGAVGGVR